MDAATLNSGRLSKVLILMYPQGIALERLGGLAGVRQDRIKAESRLLQGQTSSLDLFFPPRKSLYN
jgi:hypothetical protein